MTMRASIYFCLLATFVSSVLSATACSNAVTFKRPLIVRVWQYQTYAVEGVTIQSVASAIAGLNPSYVATTIRLHYGLDLSAQQISDFNTMRSAAPKAKFDIQLNLTPTGNRAYPNASVLVAHMTSINSKVKLDGWWFDFLSQAQEQRPDLVTAAADYAHSKGQTIGGNCVGSTVPTSADAVAFVDGPSSSNSFGYAINTTELAAIKRNVTPGTAVLGHMHCNPQAGDTSEPCVFMNDWTSRKRADFLKYWASQQRSLGFTHMTPLYFPLCPGDVAYNAVADTLPVSYKHRYQNSVYNYIKTLVSRYN